MSVPNTWPGKSLRAMLRACRIYIHPSLIAQARKMHRNDASFESAKSRSNTRINADAMVAEICDIGSSFSKAQQLLVSNRRFRALVALNFNIQQILHKGCTKNDVIRIFGGQIGKSNNRCQKRKVFFEMEQAMHQTGAQHELLSLAATDVEQGRMLIPLKFSRFDVGLEALHALLCSRPGRTWPSSLLQELLSAGQLPPNFSVSAPQSDQKLLVRLQIQAQDPFLAPIFGMLAALPTRDDRVHAVRQLLVVATRDWPSPYPTIQPPWLTPARSTGPLPVITNPLPQVPVANAEGPIESAPAALQMPQEITRTIDKPRGSWNADVI